MVNDRSLSLPTCCGFWWAASINPPARVPALKPNWMARGSPPVTTPPMIAPTTPKATVAMSVSPSVNKQRDQKRQEQREDDMPDRPAHQSIGVRP